MRRIIEAALVAAGVFAPICNAQEFLDELNFKANQLSGIHLLGVSVYSGYSSDALPTSGYSVSALPGQGNLGGTASYGATASVGWQDHREGTDISVLYTGSYGGLVRYSGVDGYSQVLTFSASRALSRRWTFTLSGTGQDSTIAQYLFEPPPLGIITQVPATFDDLAAAFSAGQYTNAQAASLLTGAPVMQAAGRSLLVGNRVLSYSAQVGITYAVSSRLQLHFASFTASGESRLGGEDSVVPVNVLMPRSIGADAGASLSYSLSPRTQIGVNVEASRTVNHFQSVYGTTSNAFMGRKMGEHWFARVQGGATYGIVTQQLLGAPLTRQIVGGGSFGFQSTSHTLVASYNRTAGDPYGFAVGTITTLSGAWNWHRPGSRWSAFASFGQQETRNTGFISLSGWQVASGLTSSLDPHTTLSAQYTYLSSSGTYTGTYTNIGVHSIRLSLGWAPQAVNR